MRLQVLGLAAVLVAGVAFAHEGHDRNSGKGKKPPPMAVLQLDAVREFNARYLDEQKAKDDGYENIQLFVPNMGWHYRRVDRVDDPRIDLLRPEFLVYADDPCSTKRRLVAVEYVQKLEHSPNRPPTGFFGTADQWDRNETFQLWTLHAWIYEHNPDGIFAAFNQRVP
jgi:hypothetical protein